MPIKALHHPVQGLFHEYNELFATGYPGYCAVNC